MPTRLEESDHEESSETAPRQTVLEDADENTLRIMLSTDNHLGYAEKDPVRGMDSFAAFEEVLYLAKRFGCDMVLIAGDLFHDNRPSRRTFHKTMEILRRYCLGPSPVQIQILSDTPSQFRFNGAVANYQDPYHSVDLPVFSIHGNHDDPTRDAGRELLAALDLLAACNLVNYFGRQEEVDKVEVTPVLLRKGTTQVALYGMGSMRDERLNRMWHGNKVKFLRPNVQPAEPSEKERDNDDEDEGNNKDNEEEDPFFNIFALHQNRDLGRGTKNCVQESMIPEWMDLVVWGHEHECLIEFFESVVGTFRITQPGSSVATSLVAGEAARKKVGILDILGKNFRLHPVPLTQVRSFVTSEIALAEHRVNLDPDDPKVDMKMTKVLEEEVKLLVLNARDKHQEVLEAARAAGNNAGDDDAPLKYRLEQPDQVLARLRVDHSGFTSLNNQRFGARFVGEVANPGDILLFSRKKASSRDPSSSTAVATKKRLAAASGKPILPDELERTNMEDLVRQYLEPPENKLKFLNEPRMTIALEDFVDKSMSSAIPDTTEEQLKQKQKKLIEQTTMKEGDVNDSTDKQHVDKASQIRDLLEQEASAQQNDDSLSVGRNDDARVTGDSSNKTRGRSATTRVGKVDNAMDLDDVEEEEEHVAPSKASKPKGRAAASSSSRAPSRGAAATQGAQKKVDRRRKLADLDEDDDDEVIDVDESPARRAPTRRAATSNRKVKYNVDDDDDDDGADASEDADEIKDDEDGEEADDIDDEEDEETPPPRAKRGRPAKATTPSTRKKPAAKKPAAKKPAVNRKTPAASRARTTTGTASTRKRKSRAQFDESEDDDDHRRGGNSADLDDDWGTAATRSQL